MELLRRIFNKKKKYLFQGMVYLNKNNNPVENEITDHVKWLDKITISAYSVKDAENRVFELFHFKYPELKNKIWLF